MILPSAGPTAIPRKRHPWNKPNADALNAGAVQSVAYDVETAKPSKNDPTIPSPNEPSNSHL